MTTQKLNKSEKILELKKYRDLVLSTIDYNINNSLLKIKIDDFDSDEHYKFLKIETEKHFQSGRLTILKQWFRDLTEMYIETRNLEFNKYLKETTHYNIDIFQSYFQRINSIIEKGKITSDNQFYDMSIMLNQLSQKEPIETEKILILNNLLNDYEKRKERKAKN